MTQQFLFPHELHIADWHDGSQYPYQIVKHHFGCNYPGDSKTPAQPFVAPLLYRTDLASIPTRTLRKLLDKSQFFPTSTHIPNLPYAVWIYRDFLDGKGWQIVGYRLSPLAYCAVIHDIICSTESLSSWGANRVFDTLMRLTDTEDRAWIYAGVQAGCWWTYLWHDAKEVQEDRAMVTQALIDWNQEQSHV